MMLATYLKSGTITCAAFARTVGVSKQTMFKYVHGLCFPSPPVLRRIKDATDGAVTSEDFVDQAIAGRGAEAAQSSAEAA